MQYNMQLLKSLVRRDAELCKICIYIDKEKEMSNYFVKHFEPIARSDLANP